MILWSMTERLMVFTLVPVPVLFRIAVDLMRELGFVFGRQFVVAFCHPSGPRSVTIVSALISTVKASIGTKDSFVENELLRPC